MKSKPRVVVANSRLPEKTPAGEETGVRRGVVVGVGCQGPSPCPSLSPTKQERTYMVGPGHRCPTFLSLLPLASIGPNKHHGGNGQRQREAWAVWRCGLYLSNGPKANTMNRSTYFFVSFGNGHPYLFMEGTTSTSSGFRPMRCCGHRKSRLGPSNPSTPATSRRSFQPEHNQPGIHGCIAVLERRTSVRCGAVLAVAGCS